MDKVTYKRNLLFIGLFALFSAVSIAQPDLDGAEELIVEDLYVQGSLCIGTDCVDGESFGFDTHRFKENSLRIHFDDTSSDASLFPNNDWRILINDTGGGGSNYFGIEDVTGGAVPFRLDAGAPSHSLYVDDSGKVGIGTNQPTEAIHIVGDGLITGELDVLSDLRVKDNIAPIQDASEILASLNAVTYDMRTSEYPDLKLPSDKQYGLIAQELLEVIPELVGGKGFINENEQSLLSINYTQLIPILIKSNQEQSELIQTQSQEIKVLNDALQMMTRRIEKLEDEK